MAVELVLTPRPRDAQLYAVYMLFGRVWKLDPFSIRPQRNMAWKCFKDNFQPTEHAEVERARRNRRYAIRRVLITEIGK